MLGYWNEPDKTAEAIDAARWMHTGDLATMDDDGYVNIVGRIKDMVIRGGENIYPREIEEFLYTPPGRRRRAGRSACPTSATARSSAPGSGCSPARRADRGRRCASSAGADRALQDPALRAGSSTTSR